MRPELPAPAKRYIKEYVVEFGFNEYKDLSKAQTDALLTEIIADKKCLDYTLEFGLLQDCLMEIISGELKQSKAYEFIEENIAECWYDTINKEFTEAMESVLDMEHQFIESLGYGACEISSFNYADKRGE